MGVLGVADADLRVVTRPHRGVAPRLGVRRAGERHAAQGEAVDQVAAQRAMAAQQGHVTAMYNLGFMHATGTGVTRNCDVSSTQSSYCVNVLNDIL